MYVASPALCWLSWRASCRVARTSPCGMRSMQAGMLGQACAYVACGQYAASPAQTSVSSQCILLPWALGHLAVLCPGKLMPQRPSHVFNKPLSGWSTTLGVCTFVLLVLVQSHSRHSMSCTSHSALRSISLANCCCSTWPAHSLLAPDWLSGWLSGWVAGCM